MSLATRLAQALRRSLPLIASVAALGMMAPAQAIIVSSNADGLEGAMQLRFCRPSYLTLTTAAGPVLPVACTMGFTAFTSDPRTQAVGALSGGGWNGINANGISLPVPAPKTADEAEAFRELAQALDVFDFVFLPSERDFTATLKRSYTGTLLFQVRSFGNSQGQALSELYLFEGLDARAGDQFRFDGSFFDGRLAWVNLLAPQAVPTPATGALVLAALGALAVTRRRRAADR